MLSCFFLATNNIYTNPPFQNYAQKYENVQLWLEVLKCISVRAAETEYTMQMDLEESRLEKWENFFWQKNIYIISDFEIGVYS